MKLQSKLHILVDLLINLLSREDNKDCNRFVTISQVIKNSRNGTEMQNKRMVDDMPAVLSLSVRGRLRALRTLFNFACRR